MVVFLGFTMPLVKGRGIFNYDFGLLPFREPVFTVVSVILVNGPLSVLTLLIAQVGKPVEMPHIPNPSNEEIDEYHAKYVEALQQLYEDNKSLLPDQPDMKIVQ